MPKTLEDVKTFLEGQDGGIELYEAITNAIHQERSMGKRLVGEEKQRVGTLQSALNKLGYNPDEHELEQFIESVSSERKTGKKSTEKLTDAERRLIAVEKEMEKFKTEAENLRIQKKNSDIKSKLSKHFKDKVYSADNNAELLILKGAVDLEGENVVWVDGDNKIDFDSGFKSYLEKNPDIAINSQRGGSSGSASDGSAGQKRLNLSDFNKLGWEERSAYLKDGGEVVD